MIIALITGTIVAVLVFITLVILAISYYRRSKIIDEASIEYLSKKKKYCLITCLTTIISFIVLLTFTLIFEFYYNWTQTALCMIPCMSIVLVASIKYFVLSITTRNRIIRLNNKNTKN